MKIEVAAGFIRITSGKSNGLFENVLHFWVHNKKRQGNSLLDKQLLSQSNTHGTIKISSRSDQDPLTAGVFILCQHRNGILRPRTVP
jgi:hypothetical protein